MGELRNIISSLMWAICLSLTFGHVFVLLGQSPPPRGNGERIGTAQINDPVEALPTVVAESRQRLLSASQTYRQSLEKLLVLQTQDADRARIRLERSRKLLESGLVPRRQVEAAELELNGAVARQFETARQLESLDSLVAEVHAAELAARVAPSGPLVSGPLVRYVGTTRWTVADLTKVDAFYRLKFGRSLPISALGQTETHEQLGFDHHDAADVAVHPDTREGQELLVYLQSQGISFIAIREAIPGSATGAHIHIGPPSRRASALR